jgi:tetratricopeptide (TPR) repeat protein
MFYKYEGSALQINCQVVPNTDVSGVGVRWALFTQAFITIILSRVASEPLEILLTTLSVQATSLAIVAATYFDPIVDVAHSVVASQFAVLFSICRIAPSDIPNSFPRTRASMKLVTRLWLLDLFFRICLISFNMQIWSKILAIQRDNLCGSGAGYWSFFSGKFALSVNNRASTFAFTYCILDITWEFLRYISFVIEKIIITRFPTLRSIGVASWDPRIRLVSKITSLISISERLERVLSTSTRFFPLLFKFCSLLYIVINISQMVVDNDLTGENYWTFGQIFAVVNLLGTMAILLAHFTPSTVSISSEHVVSYLVSEVGRRIVPGFIGAAVPISLVYPAIAAIPFDPTLDFGAHIIIIWGVAMLALALAMVLVYLALYFLIMILKVCHVRRYFPIAPGLEQFVRSVISNDRLPRAIKQEESAAVDACTEEQNHNTPWVERRANEYESAEDLSSAIRDWEHISSVFDGDWWPRYRLADVYERNGDVEKAIVIWEELVVRNRNTSRLNLMGRRLQRAYLLERGPEAALKAWEDLVMANQRDNSLSNYLGELFRENSAFLEASKFFEGWTKAHPDDLGAKKRLAEAFEKIDDYLGMCGVWRQIWEESGDELTKYAAKKMVARAYARLLLGGFCVQCRKARREGDADLEIAGVTRCERCDALIGGMPDDMEHSIRQFLNVLQVGPIRYTGRLFWGRHSEWFGDGVT